MLFTCPGCCFPQLVPSSQHPASLWEALLGPRPAALPRNGCGRCWEYTLSRCLKVSLAGARSLPGYLSGFGACSCHAQGTRAGPLLRSLALRTRMSSEFYSRDAQESWGPSRELEERVCTWGIGYLPLSGTQRVETVSPPHHGNTFHFRADSVSCLGVWMRPLTLGDVTKKRVLWDNCQSPLLP